MNPNTLYVVYILACLGLFLVVYLFPVFDLRGVGRVRRRRPSSFDDEDEFTPSTDERRQTERMESLMIFPRADLAALVSAAALASIALAALLGFLGPRLMDQLMASAPLEPLSRWRWSADAPLERVAQVTGALCLGLIAVRMMRLSIAVTSLLAVTFGVYLAVNFVLGRPLTAAFGG